MVRPDTICAALSPVQQQALQSLTAGIGSGVASVLRGAAGSGKTTILRRVQAALGGTLIGARQLVTLLSGRNPMAIEETFFELMESQLRNHDLVIFDDLHLLVNVSKSYNYPRSLLLHMVMKSLLDEAEKAGKKVVFAVEDELPAALWRRAAVTKIEEFTEDDYAYICRAYRSGEDAEEYRQIFRSASKLNAHQLKKAVLRLDAEAELTAERFLEHLTEEDLSSNVELEEVTAVDWNDLKGLDDIIRALEAKIALPLENDALAEELELKPKRGVLLAGPPGTGKTTIGRALAHRLKSKFFLLDGTVVAGSNDFYEDVELVFEAAKNNAPSILFIDDADVIFAGNGNDGFYRYLLTVLDGVQSTSSERVCVMMTAMDASSLPQAILRSGRIELWLETRLPDQDSRAAILLERLSKLPPPLGQTDVNMLASASQRLTGADLKAMVEDGKLLFAHDKANGAPLRPVEEYFLEAIETIRRNRRTYARRKPVQLTESVPFGFLR